MGGTLTVPVSQLDDPIPANGATTARTQAAQGAQSQAITVPVSALEDPVKTPTSAQNVGQPATQPRPLNPPPLANEIFSGVHTSIGPQANSSDIHAADVPINSASPMTGIATRLSLPLIRALLKVHDAISGAQNLTQAGRQAHPIQAKLGDLANNIEDLLVGNPEHGGMREGILNNPVTAAIIPGDEEFNPALFDTAREAVGAAREGLSAIRSSPVVSKAAETGNAILKGEKVAQAPAQAALRTAAGAGSDTQGVRTFLDKPIADLAQQERAAYDTINDAAEIPAGAPDLKDLYDYRSQLHDALEDPAQIANKDKLEDKLAETEAQIKTYEANALRNGVTPQALDDAKALTQKRYAGEDVAKKLFNNESVVRGNAQFNTPETVNVDSAIRNAENLNKPSRFAPRGTPTRLQQWFGKDGATKLLQGLYDAKQAGQSAVSTRKLLKGIVVGTGVGAGVLAGGSEILRHF